MEWKTIESVLGVKRDCVVSSRVIKCCQRKVSREVREEGVHTESVSM